MEKYVAVLLLVGAIVAATSPIVVYASTVSASAAVNASMQLRALPADVVGSNINFINNGSGLLDGPNLTVSPFVVDAFTRLHLGSIRFPGGSLSQFYNWWDGVGPKNLRPRGYNDYTGGTTDNNYGTDEHMQLCNSIGVKATMTINFGTGSPLAAANWVEYCNAPLPPANTSVNWKTTDFRGNQSAPRGYFSWLRGQYGHPLPYGVGRWEVGNEVYDPWTKVYNATQYASRFLVFSSAMKAVDPTIKIAVIGYDSPLGVWGTDNAPWNPTVAAIAGTVADAVHKHMYGPVDDDGQTVYASAPFVLEQSVTLNGSGSYVAWITAAGWNPAGGSYPSSSGNFANITLLIDGKVVGSSVIRTSAPRLYGISFSSALRRRGGGGGTHTVGVQVLNAGPSCAAQWRFDVRIDNNGTTVATLNYRSQSDAHRAVLSLGNFRGEQSRNISTIFNGKDVWVTEFNTLYNVAGFGIYQPTMFVSAIAMTDMALRFVSAGGASNIEQWSSLNDFYFALILDAVRGAPSSMAMPLSLLAGCLNSNYANGSTFLLGSSVTKSPTFVVNVSLGNVPASSKPVPSLDIISVAHHQGGVMTAVVREVAITAINKDLQNSLNTSFSVELPRNWTSKSVTVKITTATSSFPEAISLNKNATSYRYSNKGGIVAGRGAIVINSAQHYLLYNGNGVLFAEHGSVEFWLKPLSWLSGTQYPIMSFGTTFQLVRGDQGAIVAVWADDLGQTALVYFAGSTSWVTQQNWQHLALTWTIGGNLTLYVNGSLVMSASLAIMYPFIDNRQPLYIGSSMGSPRNFANVSLDEMRVSNKCRSAGEIFADYSLGVKGIALSADTWTTSLLHFDNDIRDAVRDQETIVKESTVLVPVTASAKGSGSLVANFATSLPAISIAAIHISQG